MVGGKGLPIWNLAKQCALVVWVLVYSIATLLCSSVVGGQGAPIWNLAKQCALVVWVLVSWLTSALKSLNCEELAFSDSDSVYQHLLGTDIRGTPVTVGENC